MSLPYFLLLPIISTNFLYSKQKQRRFCVGLYYTIPSRESMFFSKENREVRDFPVEELAEPSTQRAPEMETGSK
jgi:hypothetical protein